MKNIFKLVIKMKRNEYNTKQKELILNLVKNKKDLFTSKDIYEELLVKKIKVGLTTIYRYLDELEKNNLIKRYSIDNINYYKYLEDCECDNHFYLRCTKCGEIKHVDCDCLSELLNHITKNHQFIMEDKNIMINGLCMKCTK